MEEKSLRALFLRHIKGGVEVSNQNLSKEKFVEKYGMLKAITYALVDLQGCWYARGEMGWFGMSDDGKGDEGYDKIYWNFINSLDPNQKLYVIDCHI